MLGKGLDVATDGMSMGRTSRREAVGEGRHAWVAG
jgi:hypothetical protein